MSFWHSLDTCRIVSRAICPLISIPGLVLDRRRQPDPLVDPLEVVFFGDFLLRRNLCVLRLGGTGKVVPIDPRCGDQTGYRAPTFRAALEGRVIHPVQHLVDDQAGRAFVLVDRHSLLLDTRGTRGRQRRPAQTQQRRCARSDHVGSERALVAIPVGTALRGLEIPDACRVQAKNLRLDFGGELRIAVPFDELVWDLELAEGLDLPLWVPPQGGVGPPHDVIRTEIAKQRAEHVGALERSVRHRRRERRPDLAVQIVAMGFEPLQSRQLLMVWPRGVVGDEVQVPEVVGGRVEILWMGVPGHELAEGDALVAADILDAQLLALLPDGVRLLLVVEPPATGRGRIERVQLQPRDLVILHEHLEAIQRLFEALVGRQAAAQHDGAVGPALLDLRLLLDGDHVLAAVVLAETEWIEDREDRKSTRLNSSHLGISYAVFCLHDAAPSVIRTVSLHDALPIYSPRTSGGDPASLRGPGWASGRRRA